MKHKLAGNICVAVCVCVQQLHDLYPTVVNHIIIHNLLKWPISSSLARTHKGCLLTACELSDPECSQHGIVGNVTFQHGSTAIIHLEKERTGKREKKDTKQDRLMIAWEKNAREEKRECEMYFTLNEFRVSMASFVEGFLFTSKTGKLFLEPSCVCVNRNYFKCFQTGFIVNSKADYIK